MEGISFLTNEYNEKKAVVIDIATLEQYESAVAEYLEGLIAYTRKDEEKVPFAQVIANLKAAGKLP